MAFTLNAQSIDIADKSRFEQYATRFIEEYDWIFYVSPSGVGIEDNNVRTTNAEYRKHIDKTIKHLCSLNLDRIQNFGIIAGSNEDRIKQIQSYLNL